MAAFARNEIQVLVSTTVIEVGVNVPNATLMVVENAERFGLSQLHQLRGRVGRGNAQSYCVLVSESNRESATGQRLSALCKTQKGLEIANEDLKMRVIFSLLLPAPPQDRAANSPSRSPPCAPTPPCPKRPPWRQRLFLQTIRSLQKRSTAPRFTGCSGSLP